MLFRDIDYRDFDIQLPKGTKSRSLKDDVLLYEAGLRADPESENRLWLVQAGAVTLEKIETDDAGSETGRRISDVLHRGSVVGLEDLGQPDHIVAVRALARKGEHTVVIPYDVIFDADKVNLDLLNLLNAAAKRRDEVEIANQRLQTTSSDISVIHRVAFALTQFAETGKPGEVIFCRTQRTLSDRTYLTRPSVNKGMQSLKRHKIVSQEARVTTILNPAELRRVASRVIA